MDICTRMIEEIPILKWPEMDTEAHVCGNERQEVQKYENNLGYTVNSRQHLLHTGTLSLKEKKYVNKSVAS